MTPVPCESANAITVAINGKLLLVPAGTSIAAAILQVNAACRISVTGEPRGPLCGMGICMECRATVDGVPHSRTCQLVVQSGMEIVTG